MESSGTISYHLKAFMHKQPNREKKDSIFVQYGQAL